METTLKQIESLIAKYTACNYAMDMTLNTPDVNLLQSWCNDDNLETARENCFYSYLDKYAIAIKTYIGFKSNGKVFVLDKYDNCVMFLAEQKENTCRLVVNYNPFNVDLFEYTVNSSYFGLSQDNRYDISLDEESLIKQLHDINHVS